MIREYPALLKKRNLMDSAIENTKWKLGAPQRNCDGKKVHEVTKSNMEPLILRGTKGCV